MKTVTIIVPCFNEEGSLPLLFEALNQIMVKNSDYHWEILLIDDGSKDDTLRIIKEQSLADERYSYIELSRNFGKENAMLAGFDYASGDCAIIMDADLQHPPAAIPKMLQKWEEGFEDVYGKRLSRGKESFIRKKLSQLFYHILQKSTSYDILPNVGDFRLLDRKCLESLKLLRENARYTKGMFAWIGYRKCFVEFETNERVAGASHMSFRSLISLAVNGITSFTIAPLKWSVYLGMLISFTAFVYMLYIILNTLIYGDPVAGYPTLITVVLFLGGIQLLCLGIIGEYLGKIFIESKQRPIYIVRDKKTKDACSVKQ